MKNTVFLTLSGLAAILVSPASASTFTVNLNDTTQITSAFTNGTSTSATYKLSGTTKTLSAYGLGPSGTVGLVAKNAGIGENGLGLHNDAVQGCPAGFGIGCEVTAASYVQIDLSAFIGLGATVTLNVGSLTGSDAGQFYSSTTSGTGSLTNLGATYASKPSDVTGSGYTNNYTFTIPASGNYFVSLGETGAGGNVLLGGALTITTPNSVGTPEPGTMFSMGGALLALSLVMRKKIVRS